MMTRPALALPSLMPLLRLRIGLRPALVLCVVVLLGVVAGLAWYLVPNPPGTERSLDEYASLVEQGRVTEVTLLLEDSHVVGVTEDGIRFHTSYPGQEGSTGAVLEGLSDSEAQVTVDAQPGKQTARLLLVGLVPILLLAALFGLLFAGGSGGTSGVRGFGRIGRGQASPPDSGFDDVAGADGAVTELREVVDYLRDPGRYAALGATAPRGVLLVGPPGTGKTLIARATAGEAGVPFFSVAGAEFVESLVGVGAARIRDLFEQVRRVAPAIVFIDEIDAAGRRRGSGEATGSSEEREQTLNQLLVELDGFAASSGIVVMAATNRPDILDPALLRPGRFDRHVVVELPDRQGRLAILQLHAAGRPVAPDVDLAALAARTTGFSGADLAGLVNEAALLTVRHGRTEIGSAQLSEAIDRLVGGSHSRRSRTSDAVRGRLTARAAGHAVVAAALGHEVTRVSTVGGGRRLPDAEDAVRGQGELLADLTATVAGVAAERRLVGDLSTAAETDLEHATQAAHDLVARYGMGVTTGPVRLAGELGGGFLGESAAAVTLSDGLRARVEAEVATLVAEAVERADGLLERHADLLAALVARLEESESLEGPDLELALAPVTGTRVDVPEGVTATPS
ncbi:ATP-dependent metallopeptidase FtsH/Yme1/Tma family protein [Nocardioides coralli]|uniref:ATP-dependent metallopeptidase FtsH/Yme1/Tma family protein n=1 Tax=Nocardioides coralli TaxID=2872154 RepID=UPI001CA45325|nr:AAA family ATPase [Nocardioides coralli]QZY28194.1 AAA family ATPase [Nocardioides coralli]